MIIALKGNEKKLKVSDTDRDRIMVLSDISDKLHTLNCDVYNYFLQNNIDISEDITKKIDTLIDSVDSIYVDKIVRDICKNAIVDGFTIEEFEEHFDELCNECNVADAQSLMDVALDIFYDESETYKAM